MKILVVCQHYWPEPYPLEDVCTELVRRGHQVHVVTGVPNYPMGKIYPGYRFGKKRRQERNGVQIRRTFTIGRRRNLLFRFFNYYSYAISSILYVSRLKDEYDVVFANQTSPVMMSAAALAYARKWKKKVALYCMDLWPASLAVGGIAEGSLIERFFRRVSARIYRGADRILITSSTFREYLREKFDIDDAKIQDLPQYADDRFEMDIVPTRKKDTIDLMFAGNIGAAQNLQTVLYAADLLRENIHLRWHFVGDGVELNRLRNLAQQLRLENVIFHGRKPLEEMPRYYAMADAMLVTLMADPNISRTLPSKVQTYMAAGKPILASASGETAKVIAKSRCGFCAEPENAQSLAEAVQKFLACEDKAALGRNARTYYEANFTKEKFMNRLETTLRELADEK